MNTENKEVTTVTISNDHLVGAGIGLTAGLTVAIAFFFGVMLGRS